MDTWKSVFQDDFSLYAEGDFSEPYSAINEVHYLPKNINQGPWAEIATHHMFPRYGVKWTIERRKNGNVLKQEGHNLYHRRNWKYPIKKYILKRKEVPSLFFPALATGEEHWKDYKVKVKLKVDSKDDLVGIIFRMVDSMHHYVFCFNKGRVQLLKRNNNDLFKLAQKRFHYNFEHEYTLEVSALNNEIVCFINGTEILHVSCNDYMSGKVGIISNVPAEFSSFEIEMPSEFTISKHFSNTSNATNSHQRNAPPMKLTSNIPLQKLCSGRSIRFGDLTGDGELDIVVAQGNPLRPGNNYNMINCLTAMDISGGIIWQIGDPHGQENCLCSDLAFQIYDIDGDGFNEVICAKDFFLQILDGRTGKEKIKIPTPAAVPPGDKFPLIIGDAIYICNLSGTSKPQNILLKDRYSKVWAYDNNLNLLWSYHYKGGEIGHFPFAIDINEDGRDEILLGNVLLDHDGKELWDLKLGDHADASAIFKSNNTDQFVIAIAASDEGFLLLDLEGNIKKHLQLGHMQTVTVAKLRNDLPGYQFATNTYWGNPGIIYILDESGDILSSFQPSMYGSPICPVKWLDDGQELLLLSATPDKTGGLYDSFGSQVIAFPDDGHPTLCYDALDVTHDGWDELICWDHDNLWIYSRNFHVGTDASQSFPVKKYPELYNGSNYRSNVSLAI